MDPAAHAENFVGVHGLVSPWAAMVDDAKYQTAVDRLARLDITTWANTHGPVYQGGDKVSDAIDLLRLVPSAPPVPEPAQADLDAIVASLLVNS
jgi:hypothetical protein